METHRAIFLLSLLATPIASLLPVPLKIAVDNVVGDKPLPGWLDALMPDSLQGTNGILVFAVLMLVAVELVSQLQSLSTRSCAHAGERLTLQFRSRLFRHVQRLSISFHDRQGTADSNYRIQSDASSLQTIAVDGVIPFVASSLPRRHALRHGADRRDARGDRARRRARDRPAHMGVQRRLRQRHREVKQLESSASRRPGGPPRCASSRPSARRIARSEDSSCAGEGMRASESGGYRRLLPGGHHSLRPSAPRPSSTRGSGASSRGQSRSAPCSSS